MQNVQVSESRSSSCLHPLTNSCFSSRRELAAREHIVAHEPGKGQQAFAPNRRDMNAYRAELEKQRLDRLRKEATDAAAASSSDSTPSAVPDPRAIPSLSTQAPAPTPQVTRPNPPAPSNPLANLRISQPLPGALRVAMSRPQPIARPTPVSKPSVPPPASAAETPAEEPSLDVKETEQSLPPPTPLSSDAPPHQIPESDEPLLSSHVCSSYFVEPLSWMSPFLETGALAGKIVCPGKKCGAKLGNFDWAGNRKFNLLLPSLIVQSSLT